MPGQAEVRGEQMRIRARFYRGGTSRGLVFLAGDLPADPELRDRVLLAAYGSPHARQIDGLGGATSVTSKVAIVSPSKRPEADVDYLFGQVHVQRPVVSYQGTCGNMAAAVACFAVDAGLVPAREPVTRLRIFDLNTGKLILAEVPVQDGAAAVDGDCEIAGVPGRGAAILLDFADAAGSLSGRLLPTGHASEWLADGEGSVEASIVDAAAPCVFLDARALGLADPGGAWRSLTEGELQRLEALRSQAAERLGLVERRALATSSTPNVPKLILAWPPAAYQTTAGTQVSPDEVDLLALALSMQKPHPTYPLTGAVATGAAAALQGTLVQRLAHPARAGRLRIGHPAGVLAVEAAAAGTPDEPRLVRARVVRTARMLMDGQVLVPHSRLARRPEEPIPEGNAALPGV